MRAMRRGTTAGAPRLRSAGPQPDERDLSIRDLPVPRVLARVLDDSSVGSFVLLTLQELWPHFHFAIADLQPHLVRVLREVDEPSGMGRRTPPSSRRRAMTRPI